MTIGARQQATGNNKKLKLVAYMLLAPCSLAVRFSRSAAVDKKS